MDKIIKIFARLGTAVLLIIIAWGCAAVPTLKEGSEGSYVRLPFVRILLDSQKEVVEINSGSAFALEGIRAGKNYVYHGSHPIKAALQNGRISIWMKGSKIGDTYDEIIVSPRGKTGLLSYQDRRYRGMFKILPHGRNLQLINIVHMDDYLKGVVPPEIGFFGEAEMEAIKAQAVAARTYSMSRLQQYPDEAYDMKSDVSDQVYLGVETEKNIVSKAVEDTRGYVLRYDGQLINAYYHSTCGGLTDDIDEVWDKRQAPYLRAVEDSGYCSWSKYYEWEESYTGEQLRLMIERYVSSERGRQVNIGAITDMYIRTKTAGGRVAELVVKAGNGSYSFGKDRIRWVLRRASNPELILQSARFKVRLTHDNRGLVTRADLIGGGYGHGVGMCQCGAIGMARNGWNYENILTHYYTNTELTKLY
jgi:stage II sporulation protein D